MPGPGGASSDEDFSRPVVLVAAEMLAALADQMQDEYEVHRLWAVADREAFLASDGSRVRAVVTVGSDTPPVRFLDALPNLEVIGFTGTGYDGLDVGWARQRGVAVCYGRGANAADVAEHAVALMLAAWRGVVRGDALIKADGWKPQVRPRTHNLMGRRVGIVGLGGIGSQVARRLEGFGVEIRWWGPRPKPEVAYARADSLLDLARWSDVLMLTGRADASNAGSIGADILEALGPDGLLVNVARGMLVDQDEMVRRLRDGRLGGAALDVFDPEPTAAEPWKSLPNVVVTPHIAGGTFEAAGAMWAQLRRNLALHFQGRPMETPLDLDAAVTG